MDCGADTLGDVVGAIAPSKVNKGIGGRMNYDVMEFARTFKRRRTRAVVFVTSTGAIVPSVNRLTLKGFHVRTARLRAFHVQAANVTRVCVHACVLVHR